MVNSVSSYSNSNAAFYRAAAGTAIQHKNDVENMVKFMNGQPITTTAEPTICEQVKGTIPFMAVFGGIQAGAALKGHKWSLKDTIDAVKAENPYTRSQALKAGQDRIAKEYGSILKKNVPVNPKRGFIGRILDKLPGYSKLRATGFGQAMGKSGAGWMAVMDGSIETFTQVVPTFQQLGAEAGFKQIAKSGTKVAAGAAGWLAGDALGKGIGAAIGTAICPGVGTAVGGFIGGFIGGIIGSAVAGKASKALTGKNELEKAQDKQITEITQQIDNDPNSKLALAQQTYQQAEAVLAQDAENKDALAAKNAAYNTIAQYQAAQETQPETQVETQTTMQQPAFNGSYQVSFNGIPTVPGFNGYGYDMNQYQAFFHNTNNMSTVNPFRNNNQKLA